jgi:hypothetical protein
VLFCQVLFLQAIRAAFEPNVPISEPQMAWYWNGGPALGFVKKLL